MGAGEPAKPRPKNTPQGCFYPTGRNASGTGCSNPPAQLIIMFIQKKRDTSWKVSRLGGSWWIRTTEALRSRFTVCPHWPLGKAPLFNFFDCNLADCSIIITKTFKKSKPFFQKSCFIAFLQQCFYKSHLYPSLLRSFCVEFLSWFFPPGNV